MNTLNIINTRLTHYLLLAVVLALMTLPNLGAMSLWDMDESVNTECTREMMETGTWIVPTYNYDLRTAKPVMLYWLQRASFNAFGINEWAARFPSVLAALGTLILVYELGRQMFSPAVGLLGGIALSSCIEFVKLANAATPDSIFIFFTVLTLAAFWFGHLNGRRTWIITTSIAAGLAVLTKGPIGVGLPGLIILLYFGWNKEFGRLLDRRIIWGAIVFLLVAGPWYGLVTTETRGAYFRAFFGNENVNRFLEPQEHHRGPVVYYLGAMIVFFAPWSIVVGAALWYGWKASKSAPTFDTVGPSDTTRAHRFLMVWTLAFPVFFSAAATKLPNYIAPLYPALALLIANYLYRWSRGTLNVPRWVMNTAATGLVVMAIVVAVGLLVAGGIISLNAKGVRVLPELAPWAILGLIPLAGAIGMIAWFKRQQIERVPGTIATVAVAFVALMIAFPVQIFDAAKAPKHLVEESGAKQVDRDIRLASLEYTQESVTYYAERRVERMRSVEAAAAFLALPRPAYLFVPARVWESAPELRNVAYRVVARCYDYYRNADIIVLTNDGDTR